MKLDCSNVVKLPKRIWQWAARFFREIWIAYQQNHLIKSYPKDIKSLIVFCVPGANRYTGEDQISGGILSIASIYEETEGMKKTHGSDVIMCTFGNESLLLKHTQFKNNIAVFRFEQFPKHFKNLQRVIIHIPEYMSLSFSRILTTQEVFFNSINHVHVNILNQRDDLMPSADVVDDIKGRVDLLTQTTAHDQSSNFKNFKKFNIPLHHLSVFSSPERYNFLPWHQKAKKIAVSPDFKEYKSLILDQLSEKMSDYEVVVIRNFKYQDYLKLVGEARFTLTFGEGLDFYFIETVFSGGVSFAVYNNEFFTKDFKNLNGVYSTPQKMVERLIDDMRELEREETYKSWNQEQFDVCSRYYQYDKYKENLSSFYLGEYNFS